MFQLNLEDYLRKNLNENGFSDHSPISVTLIEKMSRNIAIPFACTSPFLFFTFSNSLSRCQIVCYRSISITICRFLLELIIANTLSEVWSVLGIWPPATPISVDAIVALVIANSTLVRTV